MAWAAGLSNISTHDLSTSSLLMRLQYIPKGSNAENQMRRYKVG